MMKILMSMKHQKEENKITNVVRKTKLWTKEQFGRRKASLDVFDTLQIRDIVTWLRLRQVDICSCYNSAVRVAHLLRVDKFNEGFIHSWRSAWSISHIKQWANQQRSVCAVIGWDGCRNKHLTVNQMHVSLHHLCLSNIIGLIWCNVCSDWSVKRAEK